MNIDECAELGIDAVNDNIDRYYTMKDKTAAQWHKLALWCEARSIIQSVSEGE